jgi:hypothetical protein
MQCFEHKGTDAVGICKSCNKAVCMECTISFPKGIACSPECEQDAKEIIEMNERGKQIYGIGKYKTNKLASGVMVWLLLSAVMVSVAIYFYIAKGKIDPAICGMSVVFIAITVIVYRAAKRTGINC